ncbi:MAG: hypothetical protein ACLPJH_15135 [Myxococcaceae bacterium]
MRPLALTACLCLWALLGCAASSPVPIGSVAETQLHAPCPASGVCEEPLSCMAGGDSGEEATCELGCSGGCPAPFTCMARTDGQAGGVCQAPPKRTRPLGN